MPSDTKTAAKPADKASTKTTDKAADKKGDAAKSNTEFTVSASVTIHATPEKVWEVLTAFYKYPEW